VSLGGRWVQGKGKGVSSHADGVAPWRAEAEHELLLALPPDMRECARPRQDGPPAGWPGPGVQPRDRDPSMAEVTLWLTGLGAGEAALQWCLLGPQRHAP